MNPAPYDAPLTDEAPMHQPTSRRLSMTWTMWINYISRILTGFQFSAVYETNTPIAGFTYNAASNVSKTILTPAGVLATGTVRLPATPFDGMEWALTSTQTITALTLTVVAGQTVKNAPATLAAGVGIGYTYSSSNLTWYRLY
jgi:hypothetical protein